MPREQLILEDWRTRDGWILALRGELDLATVPQLTRRVRVLTHRPLDRLVLNLRELTFMDCAGLRAIVVAALCAEEAGARLELTNAPAPVRRLFALTGVALAAPAETIGRTELRRDAIAEP